MSLSFISVYCSINNLLAKFEIETDDHEEAIQEVITHIKQSKDKLTGPVLALISKPK